MQLLIFQTLYSVSIPEAENKTIHGRICGFRHESRLLHSRCWLEKKASKVGAVGHAATTPKHSFESAGQRPWYGAVRRVFELGNCPADPRLQHLSGRPDEKRPRTGTVHRSKLRKLPPYQNSAHRSVTTRHSHAWHFWTETLKPCDHKT